MNNLTDAELSDCLSIGYREGDPTDSYVYALARPDSTVFYIGKGTGDRIKEHEWEARRGGQSAKCAIIRQIHASGGRVIRTKLYENLTSAQALNIENVLIRKNRRIVAKGVPGGKTGERKPRKPAAKPLVLVSFSGDLRILVEDAMQHDGIPFTRESFQDYVKSIVEVECKHKMKLFR